MSFNEGEILRQTAGLIVAELNVETGTTSPQEWAVDLTGPQYDHIVHLRGPGGERVSIRPDKDKLNIAGSYPNGHSQLYGIEYHSIKVSRDRGPRIIAREIVRRLLPGYRVSLAEVQVKLDREEAGKKHQAEIAAHLKGIAGDTSVSKHFPNTVFLKGGDSLDVQTSGSVYVKSLYLTPEQAEGLIRLLARD